MNAITLIIYYSTFTQFTKNKAVVTVSPYASGKKLYLNRERVAEKQHLSLI